MNKAYSFCALMVFFGFYASMSASSQQPKSFTLKNPTTTTRFIHDQRVKATLNHQFPDANKSRDKKVKEWAKRNGK